MIEIRTSRSPFNSVKGEWKQERKPPAVKASRRVD